jgi:hemoglobin
MGAEPTTEPTQKEAAAMNATLYERLGGNDGICAIVSDIVDLHLKNPVVATRFKKSDIGKLKRLAHEFFCAGSGGPEKYSGLSLREAHAGMNISEQEYLAVMDDVVRAMTKNGVSAGAQTEVVGILYSLKNEVIRV